MRIIFSVDGFNYVKYSSNYSGLDYEVWGEIRGKKFKKTLKAAEAKKYYEQKVNEVSMVETKYFVFLDKSLTGIISSIKSDPRVIIEVRDPVRINDVTIQLEAFSQEGAIGCYTEFDVRPVYDKLDRVTNLMHYHGHMAGIRHHKSDNYRYMSLMTLFSKGNPDHTLAYKLANLLLPHDASLRMDLVVKLRRYFKYPVDPLHNRFLFRFIADTENKAVYYIHITDRKTELKEILDFFMTLFRRNLR